jgi:hypothetical protein
MKPPLFKTHSLRIVEENNTQVLKRVYVNSGAGDP